MKVIICFSAIVLFSVSAINAQGTPQSLSVNGKWSDQVFISDLNGMPIRNQYADVTGTAFFTPDFKFGNITLAQGKQFANVKMRIDLLAQGMLFVSSDGKEGFVDGAAIKEISFADTTPGGIVQRRFQAGFPAIDKLTGHNFYQILSEGRCSFLKSIVKKIAEKKNELSGEVSKEFETYEDYYFYSKGLMKRLKKDKDFILSELADKQQEVNQYLLTNKVNFKNIDQISKLLDYYNSL